MADVLKILGQAAPGAATDNAIITVGAATTVVLSTLAVCNTGAATTFRVHARIAGAAAGVGNAIAYDAAIAANDIITLSLGITLGATDVLTVRSASGSVTFTAFGAEVT